MIRGNMDKNPIDQTADKKLQFVHQFLIEHDFENTADALMIEAAIKGIPNFRDELETQDDIFMTYYEQMMLSYNNGDWRTFFQLWSLLISEDAKEIKAYKILMLHLYVHFVVLFKHTLTLYRHKQKDKTKLNDDVIVPLNDPHSEYDENFMTELEKNMNESMEQLRKFLNTTGKELENDIELRPYFALPFIEDPYTEPFLSKVFEKPWTDQLTENLQVFVNKYKAQSFSFVKYKDQSSHKGPSNFPRLLEEMMEGKTTNKPLKSNNVPIIPNDRDIPNFLNDDSKEEQCHLCNNIRYNQKLKNTTTPAINSSEEEINSSHYTIHDKKYMQHTQELAVTKSHLCNVHSNYEKLKGRFHKLHADYHKLMSIARVLTTALENSVKGEVLDFQAMLETCIKIFPDLFDQNIKDSSHCSSQLLLEKSLSELKVITSTACSSTISPKMLDYKKIKMHLINASIKTKLFLLQALRRKITLGQEGSRDETVHEYISKDLLGLHSGIASYRGKSILPYLLTPTNISIPHPLQQSITRLLNALASFRCGRDYLSFDSTVVDMVFQCLTSTIDNNVDTITCNMMIAMLQKLSLRKQQRIYMIENGLVEWLIHHLNDQHHIMDSYRLEYATALLMNLSLHREAQRRASRMATLLISTLVELFLMDYESTLPYINGALNNFLTNRVINEEAKKKNLASVLEQQIKYKSGEIREHLEHILKVHRGEVTITTSDEEITDNDNEEYDVLESQLEENDPVKDNYGELCGESLLETCYTILPRRTQRKEAASTTSPSEQFKLDPLDSTVHSDQFHSDLELLQYEENFSRKSGNPVTDIRGLKTTREENLPRTPANKRYDRKKRNNSMVLQDSIMKPMPRSKLLLLPNKLNATPIKDRPLYRLQNANDKWNVSDTRFDVKDNYDESATYIYENKTSKESSETTVASAILLPVASEAESTVMEKLSSIASL